jgi:hypothetical protein
VKRDIDLLNIPKAMEVMARQSVNSGLPFNNKTLGDIEAKDKRIYEDLRKGTAKVRIFLDV